MATVARTEKIVIRARLSRIGAFVTAAGIVVLFVVAGIVQTTSGTGVYFRAADQVSIVVIGTVLAGSVLLVARPRVRADAEGIEVRNAFGTRALPWTSVRRVAFPDGTPWARLELPFDEYHPVLAVQAIDGQRAVEAIRRLRVLHAAAQPHDPAPGPAGP